MVHDDEFIARLIKSIEESSKQTIEQANKKQTDEIKEYMNKEINEIRGKLEEEVKKRTELEQNYSNLKNKYDILDKELKKNNIIIFGLEIPSQNIVDFVITKLNHYLQVNLTVNDINNAYVIGMREKKRPIIVKFISYIKKQEVLKKCKNLKGTNISVAEDLTIEERQSNQILRKHLKEAKLKKLNAFIKHNKLIVNGQSFTAQQLANEYDENEENSNKNQENIEIREKKISSAPATPSSQKQEEQDNNKIIEEAVFEVGKIEESKRKRITSTSGPSTNQQTTRTSSRITGKEAKNVTLYATTPPNLRKISK